MAVWGLCYAAAGRSEHQPSEVMGPSLPRRACVNDSRTFVPTVPYAPAGFMNAIEERRRDAKAL